MPHHTETGPRGIVVSEGADRPRNHLVEWLVIVGRKDRLTLSEKITLGLNSMICDHGTLRKQVEREGFGFGLWKPVNHLPATTWSFYDGEDRCCFIEGVFYDNYFGHRPAEGEDPELSRVLLEKFQVLKSGAIAPLNGSFRGFIYNCRERELTTFIDRLGAKVLYLAAVSNGFIVSTNLSGFRGLKSLSLDMTAAFQFLTIGFPIGERTLLKDIMIQSPCTMISIKGKSIRTMRYWDIPERLRKASLHEAVERVTVAMEDHAARIYDRLGQKIGLGMTGGHDSRVICSALAYKNIPFDPLHWYDEKINYNAVNTLCSMIGKKPVPVKEMAGDDLCEIQKDVFVYSDGTYLHPSGFSRLARECSDKGIRSLMLGFAGDRLSGSSTIPDPKYVKNAKCLAEIALKNQMELLNFETASRLLADGANSLIEETRNEWTESFLKESSKEYLFDVAMWQVFSNRNLKRIRFGMAPALRYAQIVFPYLDNEVFSAYLHLPIQWMNFQKAHCYAGFHRFHEFGNVQACGYPISLRREAKLPILLYASRLLRSKMGRALTFNHKKGRGNTWQQKHYHLRHEISASPVFKSAVFKKMFEDGTIDRRDLYKIHTLCTFYSFYILGNSEYMPQRLITR